MAELTSLLAVLGFTVVLRDALDFTVNLETIAGTVTKIETSPRLNRPLEISPAELSYASRISPLHDHPRRTLRMGEYASRILKEALSTGSTIRRQALSIVISCRPTTS